MRTASILASVIVAMLAAQDPNEQRSSIRHMLAASGLASLADHLPAYELDRKLTSSAFDHDSGSFVAAVYFVDEMRGETALGPLHLIRIGRDGTVVRADLMESELSGTARLVDAGPTILIGTHISPSAGEIAFLTQDLKLLGVLKGYGPLRLRDDSILYEGNMVHFSDRHQASVHVFDRSSRTSTELFPVSEAPPAWSTYDRMVEARRFSAAGDVVTFALGYAENAYAGSEWLRRTVVRCQRQSAQKWSCRERTLAAAAHQFGIVIPNDPPAARESALVRVLNRELAKPERPQ